MRPEQVEGKLNNSDHARRPGMYARVRLAGATRRAFVVPLSALVIVGGQQFVWVVADGKVSQRAVTIGTTTASVVEITSGVKPGETIVFRGTEQVREGGAVRTAPAGGGSVHGPYARRRAQIPPGAPCLALPRG